MKKIISLNSAGIKYVKKADYEIAKVFSEKNTMYNYKSASFKYALEYSNLLINLLKAKYKNPIYKILFVADENRNGELSNTKLITYLENKEIIDFVRKSLTQKSEYKVLLEKPEEKELTLFEQQCQLWSDQIQRYLSNYYNFSGTTKIEACGLNFGQDICSFNIAVSGKGINDYIYSGLKTIEEKICKEDIDFYSNEDCMFTILKNQLS